jgi:chemotaxis protein histidine kinase CheA
MVFVGVDASGDASVINTMTANIQAVWSGLAQRIKEEAAQAQAEAAQAEAAQAQAAQAQAQAQQQQQPQQQLQQQQQQQQLQQQQQQAEAEAEAKAKEAEAKAKKEAEAEAKAKEAEAKAKKEAEAEAKAKEAEAKAKEEAEAEAKAKEAEAKAKEEAEAEAKAKEAEAKAKKEAEAAQKALDVKAAAAQKEFENKLQEVVETAANANTNAQKNWKSLKIKIGNMIVDRVVGSIYFTDGGEEQVFGLVVQGKGMRGLSGADRFLKALLFHLPPSPSTVPGELYSMKLKKSGFNVSFSYEKYKLYNGSVDTDMLALIETSTFQDEFVTQVFKRLEDLRSRYKIVAEDRNKHHQTIEGLLKDMNETNPPLTVTIPQNAGGRSRVRQRRRPTTIRRRVAATRRRRSSAQRRRITHRGAPTRRRGGGSSAATARRRRLSSPRRTARRARRRAATATTPIARRRRGGDSMLSFCDGHKSQCSIADNLLCL